MKHSANALLLGVLAFFSLLQVLTLAYLAFFNNIFGLFPSGIISVLLLVSFSAPLLPGFRSSANLAIAMATMGICLFALDVACLTIGQPPRYASYQREERARELHMDYDFRGIPKVVQDLRERGLDAIPQIPPNFVEGFGTSVYPLGGVSGKTVVLCNESGRFSIYPSDEHGFNNAPGLYQAGAKALVVGDSFANGACVQPGEDIAGQLRQHGLSTITLGMWGNGPLMELATLREYGPRLRPRHVFWLYYENDIEDMNCELNKPMLRNYLERGFSQHLEDRQGEIDTLLLDKVRILQSGTIPAPASAAEGRTPGEPPSLARKAMEALNSEVARATISILSAHDLILLARSLHRDPISEGEIARFRDILALAKEEAMSWDGNLVFVFLPEFSRYQPVSILKRRQLNRSKAQVLEVARQLGLQVVDMDAAFQSRADPLAFFPMRMMGHYTPEGYALTASMLYNASLSRECSLPSWGASSTRPN